MKYIKKFEKLVDTPEYSIGDYVFINIGNHIYYGEIIDINDTVIDIDDDRSVFDYFIKYLDDSFEEIDTSWFVEYSIDRLMTEDEEKLFKEKIKILEDTNKYNL